MYKALLLTAIIALGVVDAAPRGKLLSKKQAANIVNSKMLSMDYIMEGDVNYKIHLPEMKTIIPWNTADTQYGGKSYIGAELNSYLNFTLQTELFQ